MESYIWLGAVLFGMLLGYLIGRAWYQRRLRKMWGGEGRYECYKGACADIHEFRDFIRVRIKETGGYSLHEELPGLLSSNWWKDWMICDKPPINELDMDRVARHYGMKLVFVPINEEKENGTDNAAQQRATLRGHNDK